MQKTGVQLIAEGAAAFYADMEKADKAVTTFGGSASAAAPKFSAFGEIVTGALRAVGTAAVDMAAQGAKALAGFVAGSISAAGDFEANLNVFASVTGDALAQSGQSLDDFSKLFIDLGKELPVSTAEVESAAIELAKGGIDPATISAGALRTSLDLAAAGGVGLADSATIMAKQLGVWVDSTADAGTKATFLAQTADLLSQSANATTSDVSELALGLANAGGSAKVAGLDFRETVTGLSLLAPGFSSASDAGTSFKTLVSRLIPTTKPATEAMIALGLATEDGKSKFYDAQGSFIGLKNAAELLHTATAGLSEEQKSQAFNTIFGSDAIRAAAILAEQGAAGYDRMTASLASAGSVSEQAKARQQGFNTALDNAKGSLEALQLTIGAALLPVLTTLLNNYISPGINLLTQFADAVFGSQEAFTSLSPSLQSAATTLQYFGQIAGEAFASLQTDGLGAAISTFAAGLMQVSPLAGSVIGALAPLGDLLQANLLPAFVGVAAVVGGAAVAAFAALVAPIAGTVAAIAGAVAVAGVLYAAWSSNFGNIQGMVSGALSGVAGIVSGVLSTVVGFWNTYGGQIVSTAQTTWASVQTTIGAYVQGIAGVVQPILANIATFWQNNGQQILGFVASTWNQVGGIVQAAMGLIQATVIPVLSAVAGFISSHSAEIQAVFSATWTAVSTTVSTALAVIQGVITTVTQVIQGDWSGAWETIKATTTTLVQGTKTVVESNLSALATIFKTALTEAYNVVAGFVGSFISVGGNLVRGIISGVQGAAGQLRSEMQSMASGALQAAKDALGISSPSAVAAAEVGMPFSQGVGVGIMAGSSFAIDASVSTVQQILSSATGAITEGAPEIGGAFGQGMASGIEDAQTLVDRAVEGLAVDTTRTAQDILKISQDSQAAAQDIGEPFGAGIAAGIEAAKPIIGEAAQSIGREGLDTMPSALQPALDESLSTVQAAKPGFVGAGKDLIAGMTEGVKAAAGALAQAAAQAAAAALSAAKSELGIASPSAEAADQVGLPFVQGIVQGIADSLDLIKGIAHTLSKQLTEDMQKVAEEAANAFKEILQANLEADVGFSGTALGNYRKLQDLGEGGKTAEAQQDVTDTQADLDAQTQEKIAAEQEYSKTVEALQKEREQKLFAARAKIQVLDYEHQQELANETDPVKREQLIAKYTQERAKLLSEVGSIDAEYGQKITDATTAYHDRVTAIDAEIAKLQQALDLAKARVLVEQELDEKRKALVATAQAELEKARQEADAMRATDPKAADDYYKLRSQQILELADLEKRQAEALAKYRLSGAAADRDAVQAIETERAKLLANQAAERTLLAANAQQNSPYAGLAEQLANLQNKIRAELERDQGFYDHTDRNNLEMRDRLTREIAGDQAALNQITQLLQQVGAAAMGGTTEGVEGGAAGLIAAIQAAMAQAQAAAEAQLGIHSPSKVLEKAVGIPAMQGIAEGVLRGASLVEKAFGSSLNQAMVMPAAKTVMPAASASQIANSYTSNNYGGNLSNVTINSNLGASQIRAIVRQELAAAGRGAYTRQRTT